METIKRDLYLNRLIERRENGLIKVITGIRRCGKSYLLFKLYYQYLLDSGVEESRIIRIPLDDDDYSELHDSRRLSGYIKERVNDDDMWYIFLDEVQMCKGFESVLNGLNRRENIIYNELQIRGFHGEAVVPKEIEERAICIDGNIDKDEEIII